MQDRKKQKDAPRKKNQTCKEGKKASNDRTAEHCRGDTRNSAANGKDS